MSVLCSILDNLFLRKLLLRIPADYSWSDEGIVRIGASEDVAAEAALENALDNIHLGEALLTGKNK